MDRAIALLDEALGDGVFPSYVCLVGSGREVQIERAAGFACLVPEKVPANLDTIYDLASLTKPLATSLLAILLHRQNLIRLDDPVQRFVPAYEWEGRAAIRIRHLLTHSSGLPAWRALYLAGYERKEILRGLDQIGLEYEPGTGAVYSCLDYIQLGRILEMAGGTSLEELFRELIARPLGLDAAGFNPPPEWKLRVAATEFGNEHERRKCGDSGKDYRGFRKEVIRGEVHDQNAFSLGGAAGNAGLFATARDVWRIACEILDPQVLLRPAEAAMYFENFTSNSADHRSIGLQLGTAQDALAGAPLSPRSAAHSGFTGTSLAIDPERRLILVLLTNRVHPEYREYNMNDFRRSIHAATAEDWK